MRCRTRTPCLPFAANSGQYLRDRGVNIQLAPVNQHQRGQAGHRLGRRPDIGDGVLGPRDRPGLVAKAAPHVDDDVAVDVQDERCAELLTRVQVPRQRGAHPLEPPVTPAVYVRHGRGPPPAAAGMPQCHRDPARDRRQSLIRGRWPASRRGTARPADFRGPRCGCPAGAVTVDTVVMPGHKRDAAGPDAAGRARVARWSSSATSTGRARGCCWRAASRSPTSILMIRCIWSFEYMRRLGHLIDLAAPAGSRSACCIWAAVA